MASGADSADLVVVTRQFCCLGRLRWWQSAGHAQMVQMTRQHVAVQLAAPLADLFCRSVARPESPDHRHGMNLSPGHADDLHVHGYFHDRVDARLCVQVPAPVASKERPGWS